MPSLSRRLVFRLQLFCLQKQNFFSYGSIALDFVLESRQRGTGSSSLFALFYTTYPSYSKSVAFFYFLGSHDVRQQPNTTEATNSLHFNKPPANASFEKISNCVELALRFFTFLKEKLHPSHLFFKSFFFFPLRDTQIELKVIKRHHRRRRRPVLSLFFSPIKVAILGFYSKFSFITLYSYANLFWLMLKWQGR